MATSRPRVIVAGGGPAAAETILALHALAGDRYEVELLTPTAELVLRPYEVLAPFHERQGRSYPLARLAADAGAHVVRDALAVVDPDSRSIVAHGGVAYPYDALVVAVGAQRVHPIDGTVAFRGSTDANVIKALLMESHHGRHGRVAFIVPPGVTWPVPMYELVLQAAQWLRQREVHSVPLTLVSPEPEPVAAFGRAASDEVSALLDAHGVRFVHGHATHLRGDRLSLMEGKELQTDVAITLPRLIGCDIAGLPSDRDGFLPTDAFGRVAGVDGVFAAGDITTFPVKQGGLATEQADAIAEYLAALAGAPVEPHPFTPVLRQVLFAGEETRYLLTEFGAEGESISTASSEPLWPGTGKLVGRYLAPWLAAADERAPLVG